MKKGLGLMEKSEGLPSDGVWGDPPQGNALMKKKDWGDPPKKKLPAQMNVQRVLKG
jgi:hypothetical protein